MKNLVLKFEDKLATIPEDRPIRLKNGELVFQVDSVVNGQNKTVWKMLDKLDCYLVFKPLIVGSAVATFYKKNLPNGLGSLTRPVLNSNENYIPTGNKTTYNWTWSENTEVLDNLRFVTPTYPYGNPVTRLMIGHIDLYYGYRAIPNNVVLVPYLSYNSKLYKINKFLNDNPTIKLNTRNNDILDYYFKGNHEILADTRKASVTIPSGTVSGNILYGRTTTYDNNAAYNQSASDAYTDYTFIPDIGFISTATKDNEKGKYFYKVYHDGWDNNSNDTPGMNMIDANIYGLDKSGTYNVSKSWSKSNVIDCYAFVSDSFLNNYYQETGYPAVGWNVKNFKMSLSAQEFKEMTNAYPLEEVNNEVKLSSLDTDTKYRLQMILGGEGNACENIRFCVQAKVNGLWKYVYTDDRDDYLKENYGSTKIENDYLKTYNRFYAAELMHTLTNYRLLFATLTRSLISQKLGIPYDEVVDDLITYENEVDSHNLVEWLTAASIVEYRYKIECLAVNLHYDNKNYKYCIKYNGQLIEEHDMSNTRVAYSEEVPSMQDANNSYKVRMTTTPVSREVVSIKFNIYKSSDATHYAEVTSNNKVSFFNKFKNIIYRGVNFGVVDSIGRTLYSRSGTKVVIKRIMNGYYNPDDSDNTLSYNIVDLLPYVENVGDKYYIHLPAEFTPAHDYDTVKYCVNVESPYSNGLTYYTVGTSGELKYDPRNELVQASSITNTYPKTL